MEAKNPRGVALYKDSKPAQIVLGELKDAVEGYNGVPSEHANYGTERAGEGPAAKVA